jgi:hypothetical protein
LTAGDRCRQFCSTTSAAVISSEDGGYPTEASGAFRGLFFALGVAKSTESASGGREGRTIIATNLDSLGETICQCVYKDAVRFEVSYLSTHHHAMQNQMCNCAHGLQISDGIRRSSS